MGIFSIKRASRKLALMSALVLCVISIILIALELSFLPQWVSSGVTMIDFYVYIAITGIIIILSVIEFILIQKRAIVGMRKVFFVLCGVCSIQFIVGLVHIGLLYSRYQSNLLEKCMRRSPPNGFWWNFGYQSVDDINKIYSHCEQDWLRFSMLRLFSCLVYGFLASVCLYFMQKYYCRLKRNVRSDLNKMVHASWDEPISPIDEDEKQAMEKQGSFSPHDSSSPQVPPPATIFYHSPSTSPIPQKEKEATEAIVFEKHAQRQKLYEEIAKRRQLGGGDAVSRTSSFSSGKSASSSNRSSSARYSHLFNIHPFDAPVNPVTGGGMTMTALPTYDDSSHLQISPRDINEQQHGLLANPDKDINYRGWGGVAFDIDKVKQANDQIDQQRRQHNETFAEARSRRSSKRHRKLSIVQQQQQPSQFYPSDEPVSPLETSADHWAQQQNQLEQHQQEQQQQQQQHQIYQQYQPQELDSNLEPVNDEMTPLNPSDVPTINLSESNSPPSPSTAASESATDSTHQPLA